MTGNLLDSEVF